MRIANKQRLVRAILALGLVAIVSLMSACGGDDDDTTATETDEPIVIGQVGGLTGTLESFDTAVNSGMEIAIAEFNEEGGVLGRELELVEADMASDTTEALPAAQGILDDGASFVMVPSDLNFGETVGHFLSENDALALGFVGDAQFGYEGVGPNAFNLFQGTETESAALAEWAHERGIESPYLFVDTAFDYGPSNCDAFEASFEGIAGEGSIAGRSTFLFEDESVGSQIAELRGTPDADAIVVCSFPPGGVTPIREIRGEGIDLPILIGGGFEGNFWQEAVPNLEDVFGAAMLSVFSDDPAANELFAQHEENTGEPPATAMFLAAGYMAVEALVTAMEAAESTEVEAVRSALEEFDETELLGIPTTYGPDCHVPVGRETGIVEYEGTSGEVVASVTPSDVPEAQC